VNGMSVTK